MKFARDVQFNSPEIPFLQADVKTPVRVFNRPCQQPDQLLPSTKSELNVRSAVWTAKFFLSSGHSIRFHLPTTKPYQLPTTTKVRIQFSTRRTLAPSQPIPTSVGLDRVNPRFVVFQLNRGQQRFWPFNKRSNKLPPGPKSPKTQPHTTLSRNKAFANSACPLSSSPPKQLC